MQKQRGKLFMPTTCYLITFDFILPKQDNDISSRPDEPVSNT